LAAVPAQAGRHDVGRGLLPRRLRGHTAAALARGELADLLAFVATAGITPEIGLELPMERAEEGFRAMLDGNTVGKIVFTR
jgi:D-arabinose 1-dehydrogenase-like Zn-dependent alcohol dehydrogenase